MFLLISYDARQRRSNNCIIQKSGLITRLDRGDQITLNCVILKSLQDFVVSSDLSHQAQERRKLYYSDKFPGFRCFFWSYSTMLRGCSVLYFKESELIGIVCRRLFSLIALISTITTGAHFRSTVISCFQGSSGLQKCTCSV